MEATQSPIDQFEFSGLHVIIRWQQVEKFAKRFYVQISLIVVQNSVNAAFKFKG